MRGNETPRPQGQDAQPSLSRLPRSSRVGKRQHHAQAGADVRQFSNSSRWRETDIIGEGVVEVLSDGFGFPALAGKRTTCRGRTISTSRPSQIRRFGLRTGDTIDGHIRSPKEGERYFALLKVNTINFEDPEKARHKGQLRQSHPRSIPRSGCGWNTKTRPRRTSLRA